MANYFRMARAILLCLVRCKSLFQSPKWISSRKEKKLETVKVTLVQIIMYPKEFVKYSYNLTSTMKRRKNF